MLYRSIHVKNDAWTVQHWPSVKSWIWNRWKQRCKREGKTPWSQIMTSSFITLSHIFPVLGIIRPFQTKKLWPLCSVVISAQIRTRESILHLRTWASMTKRRGGGSGWHDKTSCFSTNFMNGVFLVCSQNLSALTGEGCHKAHWPGLAHWSSIAWSSTLPGKTVLQHF